MSNDYSLIYSAYFIYYLPSLLIYTNIKNNDESKNKKVVLQYIKIVFGQYNYKNQQDLLYDQVEKKILTFFFCTYHVFKNVF